MDIEKLIEQLNARGLGNGTSLGYHSGLFDEAATTLSTLQAENEKLRDKLERVTAERDAAQTLLAERCCVIGSKPITTAFGIPLDRLRELVEAGREQEFQRHLKRFDIMPPKKNALKARKQDGHTE